MTEHTRHNSHVPECPLNAVSKYCCIHITTVPVTFQVAFHSLKHYLNRLFEPAQDTRHKQCPCGLKQKTTKPKLSSLGLTKCLASDLGSAEADHCWFHVSFLDHIYNYSSLPNENSRQNVVSCSQ